MYLLKVMHGLFTTSDRIMLGNLRNRISSRIYRGKRCVRRLKKHRFHRSPITVTWFSTALSTEFLNLPGAPEMHFVSRPMHWSVSVPKIHTHPIACTASTASANSSKSYHYPTLPGKQQHGAHTRKFSLAISPCQPCSNSTSYPP